jgi:hypothetical protein
LGPHTRLRAKFDYRPFKFTRSIHRAFATHRERVAVTGARGGKTTCGIYDTLDKAIDQPNHDFADIDRGEPYTIVIGARDYPQISRVILPAFIRAIPHQLLAAPYHVTNHLVKIWGRYGQTWVYFLSGRYWEAWQGMKLNGVWLDEFTLLKEQMYDEARTRLSDRQGWLLCTGTPHGPNWAFDRIVVPLREHQREDIFFTTWHTAQNPRLPPKAYEELERCRATMPDRYYRRTFEASWDTFAGQVYEEWKDELHTLPSAEYAFSHAGRSVGPVGGKRHVGLVRVVAGVDWGFGVGHAGAIVVCGLSRDGRWFVLDESVAEGVNVFQNMTQDSWVRRAVALRAEWAIDRFYCDPARPEHMNHFVGARLDIQAALNSVKPGIECVARYMHVDDDALERDLPCTRLYVLDRCKTVRDEARYYHWREGTNKEEPEKTMDNAMDALRYAIYTSEMREGSGMGHRAVVA